MSDKTFTVKIIGLSDAGRVFLINLLHGARPADDGLYTIQFDGVPQENIIEEVVASDGSIEPQTEA